MGMGMGTFVYGSDGNKTNMLRPRPRSRPKL